MRGSLGATSGLATAILAVTLATPGVAVATPTASWHPCPEDSTADCATIRVPVDWNDPGGPTFDLAIARIRATDSAHRIGVLTTDPGGPGGSGIDFILHRFDADGVLRQRFDIVSWDPRGVQRSQPARCSAALLAEGPTEYPASEADYRHLLDYNAELGADCRAHTGPVFDHLDTTSTAKDMDAIRAALGERQLTYYGVSYGTEIGQRYAELFPDRVRAMTLDSNVDHSVTSTYQYLADNTADFENSFAEFADWCDREAGCALHGRDVRAVWDQLYARARAGRLTDPSTAEPMSAADLRAAAFDPMYHPDPEWPKLATRLAALADGTASGAPVLARPAVRHGGRDDLGDDTYQAVWCEDYQYRVSGFAELDGYRRALDQIDPHTHLSMFFSDVTGCLNWPAEVTNPQHRLSIHGTPPILVTASRFDVGTPRSWSLAVHRQIANSVLLNYDGVGHGDYFLSPCARTAIETYLTDLRTPVPDSHCPAVWPSAAASDLSESTSDSYPAELIGVRNG
ncbi:MAG: alpha/beta fold hydrolase [Kutzneria sp.]|nr:alpha/beta fold hydrolase [Kutzneria sp.]